jgi:anti-sigma factor RsiW
VLRRRTPRGIACRELVELVTDHLDGALAPAERAAFEAHLAECDDCTAYVAQFEQTIAALGALPEDELPPERVGDLVAVFRSWTAGRGPPPEP